MIEINIFTPATRIHILCKTRHRNISFYPIYNNDGYNVDNITNTLV